MQHRPLFVHFLQVNKTKKKTACHVTTKPERRLSNVKSLKSQLYLCLLQSADTGVSFQILERVN